MHLPSFCVISAALNWAPGFFFGFIIELLLPLRPRSPCATLSGCNSEARSQQLVVHCN